MHHCPACAASFFLCSGGACWLAQGYMFYPLVSLVHHPNAAVDLVADKLKRKLVKVGGAHGGLHAVPLGALPASALHCGGWPGCGRPCAACQGAQRVKGGKLASSSPERRCVLRMPAESCCTRPAAPAGQGAGGAEGQLARPRRPQGAPTLRAAGGGSAREFGGSCAVRRLGSSAPRRAAKPRPANSCRMGSGATWKRCSRPAGCPTAAGSNPCTPAQGGDTITAHLDTEEVVDKLPTDQLAPPVPEVVRWAGAAAVGVARRAGASGSASCACLKGVLASSRRAAASSCCNRECGRPTLFPRQCPVQGEGAGGVCHEPQRRAGAD